MSKSRSVRAALTWLSAGLLNAACGGKAPGSQPAPGASPEALREIAQWLEEGNLDLARQAYLALDEQQRPPALRLRLQPVLEEWQRLEQGQQLEPAQHRRLQAKLVEARGQLAQGHLLRAQQLYQELARHEASVPIHAELGLSLWRQGQLVEARRHFARARALGKPSLEFLRDEELTQQVARVRLAATSRGGRQLASVVGPGQITVWQLRPLRRLTQLEVPSAVLGLRYTENDALIVVHADGSVGQLEPPARELTQVLGPLGSQVLCFDLERGGRRIAFGTQAGTAHVLDLVTRKQLGVVRVSTQPVLDVAFDAEGQLSTAQLEPPVRLWDIERGKPLREAPGRLGARFVRDGVYTCEVGSPDSFDDECGFSEFYNFNKGRRTHRRGCRGKFIGSRLSSTGRVLWSCEGSSYWCKATDCNPNQVRDSERASDLAFVSDDVFLIVDQARSTVEMQRVFQQSLTWRQLVTGGVLIQAGDQISGSDEAGALFSSRLTSQAESWEYSHEVVWDWAARGDVFSAVLPVNTHRTEPPKP